jgi:hypothetical protein
MTKTKLVRDLEPGDKVALDNGTATVTACEKSGLFEAAPKLGGAYQIDWVDSAGETGRAIQAGLDEVQIPE